MCNIYFLQKNPYLANSMYIAVRGKLTYTSHFEMYPQIDRGLARDGQMGINRYHSI